jgi:hypothetical protein
MLECHGVQPNGRRISDEVPIVEGPLVLEQTIVHLPEPALGRGAFGGFRGVLRVRMALAQWKVPEDKTQRRSQPALHLFDDRIGAAAVGTFVVAVFDEGDCRIRRTLSVVARANW